MNVLRAFIAIDLPPHVRELSLRVRDRFRECGAIISWVHPENVHLTIKFLGNITWEKVAPVVEGIKDALGRTRPFTMEINEVGVFPNPRYPRIIWMGIEEPTRTLVGLENRISERMEALGFPREERKFQPHITLGRVRSLKGKSRLIEIIQSQRMLYCEAVHVREIKLYKSELRRTGAVHTVLASVALGACG